MLLLLWFDCDGLKLIAGMPCNHPTGKEKTPHQQWRKWGLSSFRTRFTKVRNVSSVAKPQAHKRGPEQKGDHILVCILILTRRYFWDNNKTGTENIINHEQLPECRMSEKGIRGIRTGRKGPLILMGIFIEAVAHCSTVSEWRMGQYFALYNKCCKG